jgi:pyruvate formate lyase activating enzyme
MQGCPLRCIYCHNPDTWDEKGGEEYTPNQVLKKILKYKPYFSKSGGVTISGGEPLMQWKFVKELFYLLKKNNIHTALDTSGVGNLSGAEEVLKYTDLVICDLKFPDNKGYKTYCRRNFDKSHIFFKSYKSKKHTTLGIRHVVVPNLTDSKENISKISAIANSYPNLQRFDLLAFNNLCISKYESIASTFR